MNTMYTFPVVHDLFYSKWIEWKKEVRAKGLPSEGVYRLIAHRPIQRALATDEAGILYIGKGEMLANSNRIGKFINAINGTETFRHGAGDVYRRLYRESFPLSELRIQIEMVEDSRSLEANALQQYFEQFGEYPPLNRLG